MFNPRSLIIAVLVGLFTFFGPSAEAGSFADGTKMTVQITASGSQTIQATLTKRGNQFRGDGAAIVLRGNLALAKLKYSGGGWIEYPAIYGQLKPGQSQTRGADTCAASKVRSGKYTVTCNWSHRRDGVTNQAKATFTFDAATRMWTKFVREERNAAGQVVNSFQVTILQARTLLAALAS